MFPSFCFVCSYDRFLYPPGRAWYSKAPVLEWFNSGLPTGLFNTTASITADGANVSPSRYDASPLQCMQYSGDLIYVPRDWGHGVINAQNTIGVRRRMQC